MVIRAEPAPKTKNMATYNDLTDGDYYLVQENENASVEMVFIPMMTEKCVLVEYQDEEQTMRWFKKTESLFEVIEKLTEEQAVIYESLFDDEDDDDSDWDDGGGDSDLIPWYKDDDDDEDNPALN